jgi:pimeloyl-ACP methyl ester carboxylesterase
MGITPPAPYYELADMAIDAWNLLTALGVRKAHLVGVSMGGMILQWMAALQPSRTLSQSLIMTSTYNRAAALQPSLLFLSRVFLRAPPKTGAPLTSWAAHSAQTIRMIGHQDPHKTFNGGKSVEDFAHSIVSYSLNGPGALRQMAAVDLAACRDGLQSWTTARVPTLILHGDQDQLVPTANAAHMFDLAVKRAESTGTGAADVVREETDSVSSAEVRGPLAYTRMHLLKGFGHDAPDAWCELMIPRVLQHFRDATGASRG